MFLTYDPVKSLETFCIITYTTTCILKIINGTFLNHAHI